MSSQALEQIIDEVNTLTPEQRRQLLAHLKRDERMADLRRIQGKHVGMKTSSDAFAARKAGRLSWKVDGADDLRPRCVSMPGIGI